MPVDDVEQLRILHYPEPVLRTKAKPVPEVTERVRAVAIRMIELMKEAKGVGLAAPQVGLSWRLFVTDAPDDGGTHVYVNPDLQTLPGERESHEEGCLSIPGVNAEIERPAAVLLTATDLDGRPVSRPAAGFTARIWQHEFDHLNGVLIIDKMSTLDRLANRKKLRDLEAG